ncbi:MAG TPA: hypothetical protein VGI66_17500 [Streptosporangiaceae bacterium]
MEASPAQRRIAFALIVFALVALGAYLLRPAAHGASRPGRGATVAASASAPTPGSSASGSSAAGSSTSGAPPPSSAPSPSGQADVYQWLPFSQQGLTAAAATVVRFGNAYGTCSYTENAAAYVRPMQSLATPSLAGQIGAAYSAPGVAAARASGKQVTTGATTIQSIRAFGPDSLTFVVQITERLTDVSGHRQRSTSYAVTLIGSGTSWQVSAIELATTGNS